MDGGIERLIQSLNEKAVPIGYTLSYYKSRNAFYIPAFLIRYELIYFLYITSISSTHNLLSGAPQNLSPSLLDEQTIAKRYF